VPAVERPRLVGALEAARAQPAQKDALSIPQDGQVDDAVPVDVEGVCAVDIRQIDGVWTTLKWRAAGLSL
jgi:hypothetical protein